MNTEAKEIRENKRENYFIGSYGKELAVLKLKLKCNI